MRWTEDQLSDHLAKQGKPPCETSSARTGGNPQEDVEHLAVARYLNLKGIFWIHVPNGGKRTKAAGAKLKAMGMMAGASDFLIFDVPPLRPDAKGVALELKRSKGGSVSHEQKEYLSQMEKRGWVVTVAHGANAAIEFLRGVGW